MNNNLKRDILSMMYTLSDQTENKIMISTAAGTYIGKFIPSNKDEKYDLVYSISKELKKMSDTRAENDDFDMIVLVDVTLLSSSHQEFKMPFVYLFTDQIIGVSIGQVSTDSKWLID